jgi:sugar phosphate isomerase/epimerase
MSSVMRAVGSILQSDPGGSGPGEEKVAAMVDLCADLGAPGIGVTTGPIGSLTRAEADDRCRAWMRRMAPIAAARDVQLIFEPVHPLLQWASYVHSLRHAVDITEGQAGTSVLLDVGHLFWDRNLAADLDAVGDQVGLVQIDDVDGDAAREFRYARVQLGQGILPLAELVALIEASGFEGWYENEIGIRLPKEERVAFVREGGEWLAKALATGGGTR